VLSGANEGEAAKGSELQLKLGDITRVQAVVATVVRSWGNFIDHPRDGFIAFARALEKEKLDT
jgi:hypothetical protein